MKKILSILLVSFLTNTSFSQTIDKDYIDGQIYVKFNSWALKQISKENPTNIPLNKLSSLTKILNKYGVTKAYKPFHQAIDDSRLPYILKFDFTQIKKANDFVKEIAEVNGIEYAEKVPAMNTFTVPNDPSYGNQAFLPQINAPTAWNVFNGNSNITVAIVDNAVRWGHQDLLANIYINPIEQAGVAGVDDDGNGYIDDIRGYDVADNDNDANPSNNAMDHGTHCAGIAGGVNNNGVGISSIGWNIKIIPVKCTQNTGSVSSVSNGYGGIVYAARAGARVISCSWGGGAYAASEQAVIDYAWNKGCLLVIAAGNANTGTPSYPGAYNNSYCVASCGTAINGTVTGGVIDVKSNFSNFGQVGNPWVDIMAPGHQILSTVPTGSNSYAYFNGTSMATPLVAGLAGLMLSKCPQMTAQNVINCINSTAANIYTLAGNATYSTGLRLGAGRIDAFAAMNCAASYSTTPPVANFFAPTRTTCPNTNITFQDSSLYLFPTPAWSWTFQSGIPATSTSSNPSVQWASPGTYSVAMTITTPNGTNTITKLTYITVSNPIALPLNEGFQTLPFLPINWTKNNIGNDNVYWSRATNCGGFGTSTACAVFDNAGLDALGDRDEMRTPKYNFNNVVSARLRFDVAYKLADNTSTYYDTLKVKLTTNCGTNWTNIYAKGGPTLATAGGTGYPLFTPLPNEWRRDSIDITGLTAGQANVMFSFVNHGHYGQGIYLDNINLVFPAPTSSFTPPPPVCPSVAVTFTNASLGAGSYSWSFPGGAPATSTATNPSVTYSAGGTYSAILTAFNGTTGVVSTKTFVINSTPTIAVNNQTICAGGTATILAAGAGTYSWSTGLNGNPLIVNPGGYSVYTVTGTLLGCVNTKTVSVTIGSQLGIFITPSQATVCSAGASTLTASGAVNYTWSNNSNANPIVITPTSNATYSIIGTNGLCSGTTIITISVVATPSLNLTATPSATFCAGNSATLTAAGAYSAYTWVTPTVVAASMSVTPLVNTSYTVFATAAGGCSTNSVISVVVKPLPITVISGTNESCAGCADGITEVLASGGQAPYTYQWLPVGGTSSTVIGYAAGCYSVNVTGANACATQTSICIGSGISTGIQKLNVSNLNGLTIYPNPAHDFIKIEAQGLNFSYALYNNLGQVILEKTFNQNMAFIQINEIAKGLYTIIVEQGNEKIRKKIIIN